MNDRGPGLSRIEMVIILVFIGFLVMVIMALAGDNLRSWIAVALQGLLGTSIDGRMIMA